MCKLLKCNENMEQGEGNMEQGEKNMEQGKGNIEQEQGDEETERKCGTLKEKRTWSGGFGERQR